jgi:YidC/Oxa1 family membrane protein insertase
MDKTGIIVVAICVLLLGWGFVEQTKVAQRQAQFAATNHVATTPVTTPNTPTAPVTTTSTAIAPTFDTNSPEQTLLLTNRNARYTFTSRGGGLKLVELVNFPETISVRWKKKNTVEVAGVASLNSRADLPVLAIVGDTNLVGDGTFALSKTDDGVRAEKLLPDGLRLVKEFHLGSNYLVNATVRLENTTDKPLALPAQQWVVGTATPMGPDDTGTFYLGAMWFNGSDVAECPVTYFDTNTTFLGFFHRTPTTEFRAGSGNVVWAVAHNQFFALVAMPKQPAQEIVALPITLPAFTNVEAEAGAPLPKGVQTMLVYPAQTLTGNSNVERQIVLYAGPKEYRTLAAIGEQFQNRADLVMNFGTGFATFWGVGSFFAKILLVAMNWMHDVTKLGYGWVIVLFTISIKVLFWPLTAKATRSMKRMQALAPEIAALKEKYKDDPQKFAGKQMELWRKHKVSPMSGCLPMAIQMPVFIGFFTMIRSAIELRGAHFLWAADLSKPDTLFMIPGVTFIPFISTPEGLPFNLLPLLMGAAMLWQSHLTPPSPGMDPAQQKMMRWLPAIFILFLYNYSAGLALYWTVNNLLTILQTKMTKNLKDPSAAPAGNPALTPLSKKKK